MTEQLTFFYCIGSEVYHDHEDCRYLRRSRFQVIISGDGLRLCRACRRLGRIPVHHGRPTREALTGAESVTYA